MISTMEKHNSFKVKKLEKQVSFSEEVGREGTFVSRKMEKQSKRRNGVMERQKSFRMVMERQFSIGGTERRSKESPGKRGDTLLHLAARAGDLAKIKLLIEGCEKGSSKGLLSRQNQEGETPLYVAAEKGHSLIVIEMLKFLDLESASIGANNGFDPFHIAAMNGHVGKSSIPFGMLCTFLLLHLHTFLVAKSWALLR